MILGQISIVVLLVLSAPTVLAALWFVGCYFVVKLIRTNQRPDAYEKRTD